MDFRALFEAAPTAFVVVLTNHPVYTITAASEAYLRVSGVPRQQLIGRGLFEVFPDNPDDPAADGVSNLGASFLRVIATNTADRMPLQRYDVERPAAEGGGFEERYWSVLNTPILDANGGVACLLQSVEEVTASVRAHRRADNATLHLLTSEKRFRQLAESSTFGLVIADLNGGLSYLNPKMRELLGYSEEEVAGGLLRWDQVTPSEFASADAESVRQLQLTGKCAPFEKVYVAKSGRRVNILMAPSLLETADGQGEVAGFVLDLTERKQSERDAFLVKLDDETRLLSNPEDLIETAARLLTEHLGASRCAYCMFEEDGRTFRVTRDYNRSGGKSMAGLYPLDAFAPDIAPDLKERIPGLLPIVETDIEANPRAFSQLPLYREYAIRSLVAAPFYKAGRLVAGMAVHQETPREWLPEEVELIQTVANRCWEPIERARGAAALQASERRLRLAQRVGRIGSYEGVIKDRKLIWTPELEALYGLAEGMFGGSVDDWKKLVVPEDADRVMAELENCMMRKDSECAYEFRAVLPDGTVRWLRGQSQFFYDEEGSADRMVGVNIDIDAQKRAQAELRRQWQTFDTMLSHMADQASIVDLNGRYSYANKAVQTTLHRSLEHLLGRTFSELASSPEAAAKLDRQIQEVIATGKPVQDEAPYADQAGRIGIYEYIFSPIFGEGGQVEAVCSSSRNITERRRTEEQNRERDRQVRESARLESLGLLAGGIAHDFNNLLTGILGNASLLLEDAFAGDRVVARQIILAAERAAELTGQMLAFSGKGRFVIEEFDLNEMVRENLTLLRSAISRKVSVELNLGNSASTIQADRAQVQQVIMNLLINASEAMGNRPGTIWIRTSATQRNDSSVSDQLASVVAAGRYALLEVRDNGEGMTVDTLKRIFDPFFSTKFTGRGLGLAAVLGIVKGHKGDIEVESKPGAGAVFRVLWPISEENAMPPAAETEIPATAHGQAVLVVDDEQMVRSVASTALSRGGYRVSLAKDGAEALDILRNSPEILLVILDLTMPVMTGEQAIPLIQAIRPTVPIILSSGFSEAEIHQRFEEAGIAGFLQKPYTADAILSKVAHALEMV